MFPYTLHLVVGDWSGDGHGKTYRQAIKSSLPAAEVLRVYQLGSEQLGFNFAENVAADYRDGVLPAEYGDPLVEAGLNEYLIQRHYTDQPLVIADENCNLQVDDFVAIWLFIADLGAPDNAFEYQLLSEGAGELNIGGYGLFD